MDRAVRDADRALLWVHEALVQRDTLPESLPATASTRLIASVAHEVRGSVASIVYSADFLEARCADMPHETLRETVRDICAASRRLQLTVDGLLDHANLGPAIVVPVSLHEVLNRTQGLLRSFYRDGARLRSELSASAEWVKGNPVTVEQIFVSLLFFCAECAEPGSAIEVRTRAPSVDGLLEVQVQAESRKLALEGAADAAPATRHIALLSLLDARAATESQGGRLHVETRERTLSFLVQLPRSEGPR